MAKVGVREGVKVKKTEGEGKEEMKGKVKDSESEDE